MGFVVSHVQTGEVIATCTHISEARRKAFYAAVGTDGAGSIEVRDPGGAVVHTLTYGALVEPVPFPDESEFR